MIEGDDVLEVVTLGIVFLQIKLLLIVVIYKLTAGRNRQDSHFCGSASVAITVAVEVKPAHGPDMLTGGTGSSN